MGSSTGGGGGGGPVPAMFSTLNIMPMMGVAMLHGNNRLKMVLVPSIVAPWRRHCMGAGMKQWLPSREEKPDRAAPSEKKQT